MPRITIFLLAFAMGFVLPVAQAQNPEQSLVRLEAQLKQHSDSDLPDFAPNLFQKAQKSVVELRKYFDKTGKLGSKDLKTSADVIDEFHTTAERMKTVLGKAYDLHRASIQSNFIRMYDPKLFFSAEKSYWEAIENGEKRSFDKAAIGAKNALNDYQSLLKRAQAKLKSETTPTLEQYQSVVKSDLKTLSGNINTPEQIAAADNIMARVNLNNIGFGQNIDGLLTGDDYPPPYFPPPPPPPGPIPAVTVGITDVKRHSIEFFWHDRSDNETGNRILRTTDLSNWQNISEQGVQQKFSKFTYTDRNLQASTRYCYAVETYNNEGARRSSFNCAYTRDAVAIPIWRLQLKIRVTNVSDAGTDDETRAVINGHSTYLDYGRDDLERNTNYAYDLNLDNISELSDIVDFQLIKNGSNHVLISEFSLIANNNKVLFSRFFGDTRATALDLSGYVVGHDELRNSPEWMQFVASAGTDRLFTAPPFSIAENGQFQVEISKDEIVSRIEGLVGHMTHADPSLRGNMQWGHISGPAVEIKKVSNNTLHVDLDLEVPISIWPNPELDVDFDIELSKECVNDTTMAVVIKSKNFTSNADYALWRDIVSFGTTYLTSELINWYSGNCTEPPVIEQRLEMTVPRGINCNDLQVSVGSDGQLLICCFTLGN